MRPGLFSYANVAATAALVLATAGGGAYAATAITGHDVLNGSLTGSDIKNNSVAGRDVQNGSLLLKDLKAGQVPAAKGVTVENEPLTLKLGDDWTTIAELQTETKVPGVFMFSGAVEEASTSKTDAAVVQLRIVHNGHVHVLASRTTVGPGQSELGLALFLCDASTGAQSFQLQAQATGADVDLGPRNFAVEQTTRLP